MVPAAMPHLLLSCCVGLWGVLDTSNRTSLSLPSFPKISRGDSYMVSKDSPQLGRNRQVHLFAFVCRTGNSFENQPCLAMELKRYSRGLDVSMEDSVFMHCS